MHLNLLHLIFTREREIHFAKTEGAEILCGGERPSNLPGFFFNPTIFATLQTALLLEMICTVWRGMGC